MAIKKILSSADIIHLSKLAALSLAEEEITMFSRQLTEIIDYIGHLEKVGDVSDEEPEKVHFSQLRKDAIRPCLSEDLVFLNAKRIQRKKFKVDKIL